MHASAAAAALHRAAFLFRLALSCAYLTSGLGVNGSVRPRLCASRIASGTDKDGWRVIDLCGLIPAIGRKGAATRGQEVCEAGESVHHATSRLIDTTFEAVLLVTLTVIGGPKEKTSR